jgi:hypothetical protein
VAAKHCHPSLIFVGKLVTYLTEWSPLKGLHLKML